MEELFHGTFLEAFFTSSDRQFITAIFLNEKEERIPFHIIAENDNRYFLELLKLTTIENIEEMTRLQIEEDRKTILELALQEAKNQGYEISEDIEELLIKKIFEFNPELDNSFLFKLKLKCFESIIFQEKSTEEDRIDLRNAETPMQVMDLYRKVVI